MSTLCIEEHQNQLHLLVKPPPLLDASVNTKKYQLRHYVYTKLQRKIFLFNHVMILICYSERCSLIVGLLSDSHFLDKRLLMLFVMY